MSAPGRAAKVVSAVLSACAVLVLTTATLSLAAPAIAAARTFTIDCSAPVGFEITTPGSFQLARAVSDCGSDIAAILVSASDVVLDLRSYLIDGDDQGVAGVQIAAGAKRVTVRNGSVSDFQFGVSADGPRSVVSRIIARDNVDGIRGGRRVTITKSIATDNLATGIIAVEGKNVITNNVVAGNGSDGILAGGGNTISRNRADGNGTRGIDATAGNTISKNSANGNGEEGIAATEDNVVLRNSAVANAFDGIEVVDDNTLTGNAARGNGFNGIVANSDNTISAGRVIGNEFNGIDAEDRNTVAEVVATGNGFNGIGVDAANTLSANRAEGNRFSGIFVFSPSAETTVEDNTANDNLSFGVDAGTGVLGAGTNRVFGNGNLAQCDPSDLCVPGPATPTSFEIDCSLPVGFNITSPGTFRLRRAVSTCGSDTAAIQVSASDVVLDLGGRLIDGDNQGSAGIRIIAGTARVSIRNGSVSDFQSGVADLGVNDFSDTETTTTAMVVRSNGIGVGAANNSVVSGNVASANEQAGISSLDGNTVTSNTAAGNVATGILSEGGNTVSANTVTGNGDGIVVEGGNRVAKNLVGGNVTGIQAEAANTVVRNRVAANGSDGIAAVDVNNRIVRNNVGGNGSKGIAANESGNTIKENAASGNRENGIEATTGNAISTNTAGGNGLNGVRIFDGNLVAKNTANGNAQDGIFADAANTIKKNNAHLNGDDGIEVAVPDANTTVARNKAKKNKDFGIDAGPGVLGTGTNIASRNGNAAQCDPEGLCA